jgi:hypothetical protein
MGGGYMWKGFGGFCIIRWFDDTCVFGNPTCNRNPIEYQSDILSGEDP